MDLFKEFDSSSSEEGDNNNNTQGDMLFESNKFIPLSKWRDLNICWGNLMINVFRASSGDIARGSDEKHERFSWKDQ